MAAELTPVSPGVVRVSWTAELQDQGLRVSADEVRGLAEKRLLEELGPDP